MGWAWAGAIVWLSLTPSPPDAGFEQADKVGHLLAYGLLMAWFGLLHARASVRLAHALAFAAMGIGLEVAQGQLGYRSYEVADMLANALGVILGWAVAIVAPRIAAR